jgi:hypothetical protein
MSTQIKERLDISVLISLELIVIPVALKFTFV